MTVSIIFPLIRQPVINLRMLSNWRIREGAWTVQSQRTAVYFVRSVCALRDQRNTVSIGGARGGGDRESSCPRAFPPQLPPRKNVDGDKVPKV